MTRRARTLVALLCLISAAWAGDYGLAVDDSLEVACRDAATSSRNTCRAEAVLADLREHYLKGQPMKLEAVTVGLAHCRVGFRGRRERTAFYRGVISILSAPSVTDEKGLVNAVACFPFESMRVALEAELARDTLSKEGRVRIAEAHGRVVARMRK